MTLNGMTQRTVRHPGSRLTGAVVGAAVLLAGAACTGLDGEPSGGASSTASVPPAVASFTPTPESASPLAGSPSAAPPIGGTATTAPPLAGTGPAVALQSAYQQVISQVLPSVVEIDTADGLGSGVVFDTAGNIVTNNHVVGAAREFRVRFPNSAESVPATLVGTYPPDDLAVIRVSGVRDLRPAQFAAANSVQVGAVVLAMGNPLGLSASVTDGIVSALGRTVTEPAGEGTPAATLPDTIQTSAAINPGNSGGALVDLSGRVVGIPTLAANQQQGGAAPGIGFAVSANRVRLVVPQLIADGKVTRSGRAALGVSASSVTGRNGQSGGVGVRSVTAGGAAERAGIRAGDVLVGVANRPVTGTGDLATVLAGLDVGQTVPVAFVRDGQQQTVQVTLGQLGG